MKKITISKEGCSPIDILVDNNGAVKTVESAGNCVYSDEGTVTISTEEPTESRESIDLSSMSTVDRVFAEMARESADPSRSEEAMPRLSGIKPIAILKKRSMDKRVFAGAIDTYLSGQKENIVKIKEYLNKKGWVNLGLTGLSREPTLITDLFKVFGNNSKSISNPRQHLIEKEIDGLKVVFVFTDNTNDSESAKKNDTRSAKNRMVGHLILSRAKDKKDMFFSKQITPIILVDSDSDGKSQYSTDIKVNTSQSRESFDDCIAECVCTTESMNEIDYSNMDIQDDILKTISLESYADPSRSNESMPRLSGVRPWKHKDRVKNLFISSVSNYLKSQKINIENIKEYLDKKGWVNLGYAGLKNRPTLSTNLLRKVFGDKSNKQANKLTGTQVFETTEEGLNIVWLHSKNYNEIDVARGNDRFYKGDEVTVGYLILGKRSDPNKFFCKQITPRLKIKVETVTTSKEFTQ